MYLGKEEEVEVVGQQTRANKGRRDGGLKLGDLERTYFLNVSFRKYILFDWNFEGRCSEKKDQYLALIFKSIYDGDF